REDELTVGGADRLCAAGGVDDCQALVDEDRTIVHVHTAPVRTAMTLPLRELQRLAPQLDKVVARGEAEDTEDRTHDGTSFKKKARTSQCRPWRTMSVSRALIAGLRGAGVVIA